MLEDPQIGDDVIFINRAGCIDKGTVLKADKLGQSVDIRACASLDESTQRFDEIFEPTDYLGVVQALKYMSNNIKKSIDRLNEKVERGEPIA